MGIRKWLSRKIGSYSMDLSVADAVIKHMLEDPKIQKLIEENGNDYKLFDKVMKKLNEIYKVTDPQYYEAFMEKWEEYKQRLWQLEFDKKRDKYT